MSAELYGAAPTAPPLVPLGFAPTKELGFAPPSPRAAAAATSAPAPVYRGFGRIAISETEALPLFVVLV